MKRMETRAVFGLYVVMTDPLAGYERCAEAAVAEGIVYLQLRMKGEDPAEVRRTARAVRAITRGTGTRFIVNDDLDVAMAVDADGVHLGQGDLPLDTARQRWGAERLYGWSTHNEAQQARSLALQPDYVGVGPVFRTPTKAIPDPVLGTERMGAMIRGLPLTAVAIGGIDAGNLPEVLARGAENFCSVRPIMHSAEPGAEMRRLMDLWRAFRAGA